ncbi:MAG: hypothetical protein HDR04_10660 [Lachnospiraceae bacterium]|nr:hypothetical protein [Lachnospiraceae bacterium]
MKRRKRNFCGDIRCGTPPWERITALERENLINIVSDREGQSLLESYCRIYRIML